MNNEKAFEGASSTTTRQFVQPGSVSLLLFGPSSVSGPQDGMVSLVVGGKDRRPIWPVLPPSFLGSWLGGGVICA